MYHLYSNAIIVKTNLMKCLSSEQIFHNFNNNTELLVTRFKDESKTEGFISKVKNIHLLPADEKRIYETAVDFITKDGYMMFFTSSVSYVYKSLLVFEELYPNFQFSIIKHPFNYPESHNQLLEDFIVNHLQCDKIKVVTIDHMFGLTLGFVLNNKPHIVKFFTNGQITFGMMNEKDFIEFIFEFIVSYHNFYDDTYEEKKN